MQALRFVWAYSQNKFGKDRLRASMRLLLDRPELADMVVANLARWKDWGVQSRLMKLYDDKEYNIPSIKQSIVRFMLVSARDFKKGTPTTDLPKHVLDGKTHLAVLEKKDPKTFRQAKRFFFQ